MAGPDRREDGRSGDGDEGSDRRRDHEAQERELLEKLPDAAPPDQERGERHATGKGTATAGAGDTRREEDQG
jgi:hypothetical protein